MKKFQLGACMVIAGMILLSTVASASTFIYRERVVIPTHQTYLGNVFIKGQDVIVNGRIKGDLFVMGKNVSVRGIVNGDVTVLGEAVSVTPVEVDDIRVAGKTVYVRGKIFNDIMVLAKDANIGGNSYGCAYVFAEKLMLSPYTLMRGDLWYIAETVLVPASAAIRRIVNADRYLAAAMPVDALAGFQRVLMTLLFLGLIINIAFLLIIAAVVVKYMPNQVKMITGAVKNDPLQSMAVGLLSFIAAPLVLTVLVVTLLGIPFALVLGVLFAVLMYVSKIFIALVIGEWLILQFNGWHSKRTKTKKKAKPLPQFLVFVLGLFVYQILTGLPVVGGIISFVALILGLGAIMKTRPQTFKLAQKKGIL